MQEGNEMAFQFAGDRGQHLMAALDAADQQKAKFEGSGPVPLGDGIAKQVSSKGFELVGAGSEFAQIANDPELAPGLYDKYRDRLMGFNADLG
jgi:phosphoribosylamine-glycine ligase